MIFDRKQIDVDTAIRLINEKVKTFQELSENEIKTLEKGTLTINTLNRIENMQEVLKGLFEEMGYFNTPISVKKWQYSDIFKIEDFDRILNNLKLLKDAFFIFENTPDIPDNNYRKFQTINAVEKILYDLDVMINDVKSYYLECGTFECGEE
jgi:hypothetical protein